MWKHKKTISGGERYEIQGYNIWDYNWSVKFNKKKVLDPIYGYQYDLDIVEFQVNGQTIKFGTVEFSNNIYGIYLEEYCFPCSSQP